MDTKATIGMAAVAFLLLLPLAQALEYHYYCLDDSTRQKEAWIDSNMSGTGKTYVINQSIPCEYGCDSRSNACQPAPFQQIITVSVFIGVVVVLGIAIVKLKG